ncbi:hypothetical protein HC752_21325 [Vibrio sp. S9_S30]|uniref:hypothetical protein n=1 Tax=Vibrio sp. S9_S30 TaxID=2720226 RepID=UPI001681001D|nr:hypothetical protein [Vibrio sp. S9_S30]MBD1559487.1 hypothetical protein [Vibrio sp. S9_S30]
MIAIAFLFCFILIQSHKISSLRADLDEANVAKGKKEAELSIAVAFNQSLTTTVDSLVQQLDEGMVAEEWRQQLNATMDAKLKTSILDLGKLFDDEAKNNADGCSEQYSPSIYDRMLKHYETGKGDSGPG